MENRINNKFIILFLVIGVWHIISVINIGSKVDKIIYAVEEGHNIHNKVHELYKETVQLNNYFQNKDCGDYYDPQTVIVDCPLIKHQND